MGTGKLPTWLYELKLDGFRAQAIKTGGRVALDESGRLRSRCQLAT